MGKPSSSKKTIGYELRENPNEKNNDGGVGYGKYRLSYESRVEN